MESQARSGRWWKIVLSGSLKLRYGEKLAATWTWQHTQKSYNGWLEKGNPSNAKSETAACSLTYWWATWIHHHHHNHRDYHHKSSMRKRGSYIARDDLPINPNHEHVCMILMYEINRYIIHKIIYTCILWYLRVAGKSSLAALHNLISTCKTLRWKIFLSQRRKETPSGKKRRQNSLPSLCFTKRESRNR